MSILIKNVLLDNKRVDIFIENNKFTKIDKHIDDIQTDKTIDGNNKVILPGFYNLHCHAGMNLLRGYCEDLPLFSWLQKIWQKEATLTAEDIYNGTRLAILEMIKSGTVFFADMYWFHKEIVRAVEEMGIRADVGVCFMDRLSEKERDENFEFISDFAKQKHTRITVSPAPHAIYTCSKELYKECYKSAMDNVVFLQTHLAETETEYNDCIKNNNLTPVEYLDSMGVLNDRTIAAHSVYFTEKDAELFASKQSVAVHNPCSNMKLSSGIFNMPMMKQKGVRVALGTDGCSSNNNLSMIEEMKFATLLSKVGYMKADALTAQEIYNIATFEGATAYNINAGKIEEGRLADCILVDLNNERMTPNYNTVFNMVYSADSSCIDTLICDGRVLMENHHVENEEEIIEIAQKYAKK